ncbi:unnamed protein product [Adineta steineri]|uniref:Uncharacterized protein n=1 Tax=Adineta steineri TaxID=433720 RepID=A0A819B4N6_9BILA|nr:unnamed protein product [Adineta steineri]
MDKEMVVFVCMNQGVHFFTKHHHIILYLNEKNTGKNIQVKIEATNYLPRTFTPVLPHDVKVESEDKQSDPILFCLFAEVVDAVDANEKITVSRKYPFRPSSLNKLFVINIKNINRNAAASSSTTTMHNEN